MLFTIFLEHSIQMALLIVFVFMATLLLQRASKLYSYLLWCLVFVRLLLPFQLTTSVGVLPDISLEAVSGTGRGVLASMENTFHADYFSSKNGTDNRTKKQDHPQENNNRMSEKVTVDNSSDDSVMQGESGTLADNTKTTWQESYTESSPQSGTGISVLRKWLLPEGLLQCICLLIWLCGVLLMGGFGVRSVLRVRHLLRSSVACEKFGIKNLYRCGGIATPLVNGVVHPKIYMPLLSLKPYQEQYILEHEQTHIRRRDSVIKALSYVLLCLHWFNPLVWIAFRQLEQSMEFSCDEAVVKRLGKEQKKAYSTTLLNMAAGRLQSDKMGVIALGFLEKRTKKRVKNVLQYEGRKKWTTAVVSMALIGCFVCLLSERSTVQFSHAGGDSAGKVTAQVDMSKLRVQDEEGRSGLPVIVLDKDGNIIGTHGGSEMKFVFLDYVNQIIDGEFSLDASAEYRIESGAFSACPNMTRLIAWNVSNHITYIADDAFRGCRSDLVIYCDKDTYIWKRLGELGIQRKELVHSESPVYAQTCMFTTESRAKELDARMNESGINSFTREELRDYNGDPFFYMVEGGTLLRAGGSVLDETQFFDTGLEYPSEAKIIDSSVFVQNPDMAGINIPPYIEEIADSAFMCTSLKKIEFELDDGKTELKRIGDSAFMQADFSNSPKLVIPEGVTEIGQKAFEMCEGLEEVVLPKSLKVIGGSCFYACHNLKKVTVLSPDVQYKDNGAGIGGAFGYCGVEFIESKGDFTPSETVIEATKGSTTEAYVKKHATKAEMQEGLRFQSMKD